MEYDPKTRRAQLQRVLPAGIFVIVLALAVFGWGLHSKLSLYHVSAQSSAHAPVAKLLSQRERPSDRLEQIALSSADPYMVVFAATALLLLRAAEAKPSPRALAPPPERLVTPQGPSLLRPPPPLG
jgi:hypothetical protein